MKEIFTAIAREAASMTDAQLALFCDFLRAPAADAQAVLASATYEEKLAAWRLLKAIREAKNKAATS